jgi:hypothetical protein
MADIQMPQKKANAVDRIMPVLSTIWSFKSGGFAKNPKDLKASLNPNQNPNNAIQTAPKPSPIERRMEQQQQDPLNVLGEAKQSLAYMPADLQQKYQGPIDDAYKMALERQRQNQRIGVV